MLVVIVVMVVVVVVVMAVNTVVDHLDEPHERPRQASQVYHCFCHAMLRDIRKPAGDRNHVFRSHFLSCYKIGKL